MTTILKYQRLFESLILLPKNNTNPKRQIEISEEWPAVENKIKHTINAKVTIFLKFQ